MNNEFDFDYWMELAESDSEAFENERRKTIEELILSMPEQYHKRLRQLQWKIDTVRMVSPNPLASCIRISTMLMDHTYGEGGFLDALNSLTGASAPAAEYVTPKAVGKVLDFTAQRTKTVN